MGIRHGIDWNSLIASLRYKLQHNSLLIRLNIYWNMVTKMVEHSRPCAVHCFQLYKSISVTRCIYISRFICSIRSRIILIANEQAAGILYNITNCSMVQTSGVLIMMIHHNFNWPKLLQKNLLELLYSFQRTKSVHRPNESTCMTTIDRESDQFFPLASVRSISEKYRFNHSIASYKEINWMSFSSVYEK